MEENCVVMSPEGDVKGNVWNEKVYCCVLSGCASIALCFSSSLHLPTGAAVPELQLFGQFGGSPILLATTEQLMYFDCRSYVK